MPTQSPPVTAAAKNPPPGPSHHYVVRDPFGSFRRGQTLTEQADIDAAHKAGHGPKLVRIPAQPAAPAPVAPKAE